jgi:hypothetical protein
MIDYEKIITAVVGPQGESDFKKLIKDNATPEEIYDEFILNKKQPYMEIIRLIDKENLPKKFKEKMIEYHKQVKDKSVALKSGEIVGKVDKFTIINKYKGLSRDDAFESFKAVMKLFKKVVDTLKSKGFDSVIYGDVWLANPDKGALADYNYVDDKIRVKLYRNYPDHAYSSLIHELAHRIWYKLMEARDKKDWYNEYDEKIAGKYTGKFPGFPSSYAKKNEAEYFAYTIEQFIVNNKRYSELIDLIV